MRCIRGNTCYYDAMHADQCGESAAVGATVERGHVTLEVQNCPVTIEWKKIADTKRIDSYISGYMQNSKFPTLAWPWTPM